MSRILLPTAPLEDPTLSLLTPPPTPPLDGHVKDCVSLAEGAATVARIRAQHEANLEEPTPGSCLATYRPFTVQLTMELEPNELVALAGDAVALGEWQVERAVPLRPSGHLQWTANVLLQPCRNVSYRYFTYVLDPQGSRLVRRWETELRPRSLATPHGGNNINVAVDRFGEIAADAQGSQRRGWLTNETIVQLKLERERLFQVHEVEKFDPESLLVKVVPLLEDRRTVATDAGLGVEVARLQYGESQLQRQPALGVAYRRGDVVIFHLTVPRPMKNAFALVFHSPDAKKPVGQALVTAAQLAGSEGELELDVLEPQEGATKPVARLTLPYLVVQPLAGAALDLRTTFAHYWPRHWPNLDVGHRGNGRSFVADAPPEPENTVASFLRAHAAAADMVELDVHLTSDGVPVIWHDFAVKTAPHGKEVAAPEQLESVLLKDLSYAALKELRVFAVVDGVVHEYPAHNAEPRPEHRIFPRLVDVLRALPLSLGIDVEIKWPQRRACGGSEAQQTIDKNFFVDRILQTVLEHGCGRPLIFSSFDADICTMIRFKQNLLPVMFLTMGQTAKWRPFLDLRTRTFEQAVNFAQAFELLGTAPHAEDFLGDDGAQLMQLARNVGQIAVVWGDDCNSRERVQYFKDIGATATCYDRSDLNVPEGKAGSFFNTPLSLELFAGQCQVKK